MHRFPAKRRQEARTPWPQQAGGQKCPLAKDPHTYRLQRNSIRRPCAAAKKGRVTPVPFLRPWHGMAPELHSRPPLTRSADREGMPNFQSRRGCLCCASRCRSSEAESVFRELPGLRGLHHAIRCVAPDGTPSDRNRGTGAHSRHAGGRCGPDPKAFFWRSQLECFGDWNRCGFRENRSTNNTGGGGGELAKSEADSAKVAVPPERDEETRGKRCERK